MYACNMLRSSPHTSFFGNATLRPRLSLSFHSEFIWPNHSSNGGEGERMSERLCEFQPIQPLAWAMEFPAQFRVLPLCIKFALPVSPSVRTRSAAVAVADIAN